MNIKNMSNFESNLIFLKKTNLVQKNKKIFEIGSGLGFLLKNLQDKGYNIIGSEVSDKAIEFAKKELNMELIKIENDYFNFPDNSFDIVMSFDVFEHIPDSDKHLKEVRRILKPGGCYLLSTPNKFTNIPFEILKEKSINKWKQYHCSLHSYWQLKNRFKRHRFEVKFEKIPVINDYFKEKIKKYFGFFGLLLIKILNPDKLPIFLKTNYYIIAYKK
jgi:2-polyprenyl-3-methyl-5-hydroxy-6-metoxy-1,4-benzoquinol methylase